MSSPLVHPISRNTRSRASEQPLARTIIQRHCLLGRKFERAPSANGGRGSKPNLACSKSSDNLLQHSRTGLTTLSSRGGRCARARVYAPQNSLCPVGPR